MTRKVSKTETGRERIGMALFEEVARSLVPAWQQALRLTDWDVELHIIRGYLGPQTYGSIEADSRDKTAVLNLIDPRDWPPETLTGSAVQNTIIHELLHLHMRQAGYSYEEEREEPLIHQLAKSLLRFVEES